MKKFFPLLCLLIVLTAGGAPVHAISPYTTWTLGTSDDLVPTQDAYTPLDQIDLPVSGPQDMFYAPDASLYIADTGNGRILRLDSDFEIIGEFGQGILQSPSGIFVDESGTMYIADSRRNMVVILDADGSLIREFGRPSEPLFGANRQFLPRKIAVDARQNLYVVSEGSVDGLVMLNTNGNFIGYFGANSAEMSLKMILQRMFLTPDQLEQFIRNEAPSPTNLVIDSQSLVYTVTFGVNDGRSMRKYTISGRNLLEWTFSSDAWRDIHASDDGLLIAVDAYGVIAEYDLNGTLLFVFGGQDTGDQRLGLLSNPTAIERVGDDIYVLDRDKNAVIIYRVTEFARRLHDGVSLYMEGFYAAARPYFEQVLTDNGLVLFAYRGIADAEFNEGDYASALDYYQYAGSRSGYSQAFWELRNTVLQRYLGSALGVLFGGWIVLGVFTRIERRRNLLDPLRRIARDARRFRLVDDFYFLFRFIKQPVDSFYYIKHNQRGSLLFAFIIYGWVLVVRVLSFYLTGYLFRDYSAWWQIRIETELIYAALPILLWNAANYLVATISDGEGSLRQVIIGTAYSLFPYALFALPVMLLSNVLTYNEEFVYTFSNQLIVLWMIIMLVIMVKEIHNYSVSETVRNIIVTLFTMALFLLTGYILYVLFTQLYEFVLAISQEVGLRG